MLGPVQKKWLKDQLIACDGTFKVICSSVPWDFRTKGDSLDTWNGYKEEHEEILSFIEEQENRRRGVDVGRSSPVGCLENFASRMATTCMSSIRHD